MAPRNARELAEFVRATPRIDVPLLVRGEGLSFRGLTGEIRHDVADGVVSCPAGTSLAELNDVLARDGRCLPYAKVWPPEIDVLADLILLGLPHAGEARFGSWRDWILGATMVTAEGEIVKSGSRVVKSVAGYDAHKLLVGSRGSLILPAEFHLRTFPVSVGGFPQGVQRWVEKLLSIGRVRPSDLASLRAALGPGLLQADEAMGTAWTTRSVQDWPSYPNAWSIDPYAPAIPEPLLPIHRRTKAVLDPTGKLAPGVFANLGPPGEDARPQ